MKKRFIIFLFLLLAFPSISLATNKVNVKFKSCVDGDTANFIMNNKTIKVRFLAIDTPEIKHGKNEAEPYGIEASDYTCNKLKNSKKIVLEFDSGSDKLDKYNRYLAWVYVDDSLLQKELVSKGYAEVKYIYGDYKYTDILKKEQAKAKNRKLGIWNNNEFDLKEFVMNLNIVYKIIITIIVIIGVSIYLYFDTKARKKALRKGKKIVKDIIKDSIK